MSRGGTSRDRDAPERRCLATGESGPRAGLIRFVLGPDGVVVPDVLGKLPGRGFYVTADREALGRAVSKRLFSKGAKAQASVPPEWADGGLADLVEDQVLRRVQDGIAMARKAGRAVSGYEKVRGWLESGEGWVLVQASDGSARGKSKLNTPPGGRFVGCLTGDELGLCFGRPHVIHAALAAGGLTTRVVEDAGKLSGLRKTLGGDPAPRKERTFNGR
ncbi:MAG: RNA-binding protein [Shimia sp.]